MTTTEQTKPTLKQTDINRWNNISSDQDQQSNSSSQSQKDIETKQINKTQQKAQITQQIPASKQQNKKKQPHIVPFDAKKRLRPEFSNIKTVKGGFKPQKLQKKTFHLNAIKNPFAFDIQDDEQQVQETKEEPKQQPKQQEKQQVVQVKAKKTKKTKKQQQQQDLEFIRKELGLQNTTANAEGEGEKKKKKKKPKKVEQGTQKIEQSKQQTKIQETKPTQQFQVKRQTIQQVMKKKAAEATKATNKKSNKVGMANLAKKAIEQRQAKNKTKKQYVDL